ncbi:hypothetical protein A2U01_0086608, partial [Trifolium medium]|nr:hypothetical protein [Trifolium medium]
MKLRDALLTEPPWTIFPTDWCDAPSTPARRAIGRRTPKPAQHNGATRHDLLRGA